MAEGPWNRFKSPEEREQAPARPWEAFAEPPAQRRGTNPIVGGAAEFAAGVNRQLLGALDFIGTDTINAGLALAGSERRVPRLTDTLGAKRGDFLGEGAAANILGGAGEVAGMSAMMGGALRQGAGMLNPLGQAGESAAKGVLRQVGASTPSQDVIYGALAGAGEAMGREIEPEYMPLVGAILLPSVAAVGGAALRGLLSMGANGIRSLTTSLSQLSDDGAATLLAEAMVRENLSPDEVVQRLAQLGDDAIPADVGNSFARLLRSASNRIPRIEGRAAQVLDTRQAGQSARLINSVDDVASLGGLSLDDEIARLDAALRPQLDDLYNRAREQGASILFEDVRRPLDDLYGTKPRIRSQLSERLQKLLRGDNSLARAFRKAESRLADKRALGDNVTSLSIIDTTKQELDDQINVALRQGRNNRARDLVRLKNALVQEADQSVPLYAEARQLYAGKASMESAAEAGTQFLKLQPREVRDLTSTMTPHEMRMFRLGAKQAILDKANSLPVTSDLTKRLFGRNGDVEKLRAIFPDADSYQRFAQSLEREVQFALTRRVAQGNSTSAQQLADLGSVDDALGAARTIMGDPDAAASMFGRILRGISSKRGSEAHTKALEQAGDILLTAGIDPEQIRFVLRRGDEARLRKLLETALLAPSRTSAVAQSSAAAALPNPQPQQ